MSNTRKTPWVLETYQGPVMMHGGAVVNDEQFSWFSDIQTATARAGGVVIAYNVPKKIILCADKDGHRFTVRPKMVTFQIRV